MMDTKPTVNPANTTAAPTAAARKRIPMSVPQRRLEVPDIPGYHLYWFLDKNVPRAIQGGYELVNDREVELNTVNVGAVSGNADLGSNIKVIGGTGEDGQPEHLNLMKIPEEWWKEDQKVLEKRNAAVMSAIFQGESIPGNAASGGDNSQQYVKTALMNRPARKGNR